MLYTTVYIFSSHILHDLLIANLGSLNPREPPPVARAVDQEAREAEEGDGGDDDEGELPGFVVGGGRCGGRGHGW